MLFGLLERYQHAPFLVSCQVVGIYIVADFEDS